MSDCSRNSSLFFFVSIVGTCTKRINFDQNDCMHTNCLHLLLDENRNKLKIIVDGLLTLTIGIFFFFLVLGVYLNMCATNGLLHGFFL